MRILITGGAGYIGSHTAVVLLKAGYDIIIYDNFGNCHPEVVHRIKQITNQKVVTVEGDVRDQERLQTTLSRYNCDAVIHFAGKKSVSESASMPLEYYDHNVNGTLQLLKAMQTVGLKKLVFSSSATVYGSPRSLPIREDHPLSAMSPYGRTKLIIEEILRDLFRAEPDWKIAILRYFNPVGAHESGLIGEDPKGIPNNLMPYLAQVAIGRLPHLTIFGDDYPTPDGTGVRDYIHVMDLAEGHVAALQSLIRPQCEAYNLGTGCGTSVLELVRVFEEVSGRTIPYRVAPRRPLLPCVEMPGGGSVRTRWDINIDNERLFRSNHSEGGDFLLQER